MKKRTAIRGRPPLKLPGLYLRLVTGRPQDKGPPAAGRTVRIRAGDTLKHGLRSRIRMPAAFTSSPYEIILPLNDKTTINDGGTE